MIKISFCFEQSTISKYVQQQVKKGFSQRGIYIQELPVKQPDELLGCAEKGIIPDILIFSDVSYMEKLLTLKEYNPSMISILTDISDSADISINEEYRFLLQPFYEISLSSHQKLWNCVCKAYDLSICDNHTFTYYHRPVYRSASLSHILFFASEGRCIRLVTRNGSDSFYGRLNELEEKLSMKSCHFIRIHQSYLVNAKFIASYNYKSVTLLTGEELRISKPDYYDEVKKAVRKK